MCTFMLQNISVKDNILDDSKYDYLFSVDVVNELALSGMPFREAYKTVGETIESGTFRPNKTLTHTHEGSIGNLQNDAVRVQMEAVLAGFPFQRVKEAVEKLVK